MIAPATEYVAAAVEVTPIAAVPDASVATTIEPVVPDTQVPAVTPA